MVPVELQQAVNEKIQQCIEKANKHFQLDLVMPEVRYDLTGRTAGYALLNKWAIRLNRDLLIKYRQEFIDRTVVHEFAHLVDYVVHPENFQGKRHNVHGPTFKFIVKHVLHGASDSRCHSYDITDIARRVPYRCNCGCNTLTHLGPVQHRRAQKGTKYHIRGHKGYLVPAEPDQLEQLIAAQQPEDRNRSISKFDQCKTAFDPNASRKENIKKFMELGCTPAGASTYYYKIKKLLQSEK